MFNLPEISESFSEVVFDQLIRETDQLPVAYGKTFEEFYGLPAREEIVEEAPKSQVEATPCSDECIKTMGGNMCVIHKPEIEEAPKQKQREEIAVPDVCGDDCEYRWGNNCAAHWREENEAPRRITSGLELKDILRKYRDPKLEIWEHGMIEGEQHDLWMTNSVAIRIEQSQGFASEVETVILSRELLHSITRANCMKHGSYPALFAKCSCGKLW